MFQVAAETVDRIYQAQPKKLRGRLRLDVSSTQWPANPARPCDREAARIAVGERLLRLLGNLADDAVLDVNSPPSKICVLSAPGLFEESVVSGLVEVLGLDRQSPSFNPALMRLADDFFLWAGRGTEARDEYGLEVEGNEVYIRCEPFLQELEPLNPPDENRSGGDLGFSFQREGLAGG